MRPPKTLNQFPGLGSQRPSGADILEAEMRGEQAYALGLSAKHMQVALLAFAKGNGDPNSLQTAADAVQSFFIQREMIGLTAHDFVIEFYKIPKAVLARVGASEA